MRGRPAATLLHLGPGLANALANLHNARKARSAVVNIVGEHSTAHLKVDAPLTADIAAFARTVSGYVGVAGNAADVGDATSAAIAAAVAPPGHVATLIVPADLSWSEGGACGPQVARPKRMPPPGERISAAAQLLRAQGTALLLGGTATSERALTAAGRIAAHTGVPIFADRNAPRIASGRGRFHAQTVPYFPEPALTLLAGVRNLILVETQPPVSFFGYPNTPSCVLPPESSVFVLAERTEDGAAALESLADACDAPEAPAPTAAPPPEHVIDERPLTADAVGAALAAHLPGDAIISDEMVSAGAMVLPHLLRAAPHDRLPVTGGSIGQGLPVAVGAACACPDRKVFALEADGSGMYTPQSLWTMARENLDVLIVIFANRRYQILEIEMRRTGAAGFGEIAAGMIDIGRPILDWVHLASGMGVPATRAITASQFDRQLRSALEVRGPRLIEACLV
jgi:acetolactate synthase-1/2/3 large subunit